MGLRFVWTVGLLALFAAAPARADDASSPPPEDLARAQTHFREAEAHKNAERYQDAAEGYLAAYDLLPDAEFLFNAGRMYLLAGDEVRARRFLEKYLEQDPDGRGADDARQALDELDERGPGTGALTEREAKAALPERAITEPPPAPPGDEAEPSARITPLRIAALSSAGAGLVALGAGGYFGVRAGQLSDETAAADTYDPDLVSRGESYEVAMFALTGVGAAAIITGGVLYYMDATASAPESERGALNARPLISPGLAGLALGGRF